MKSQLFQNSIVDSHYKSLDENLIKEKFQHYTDNYKTDKHIREIRTMKEEEYQDGFLRHIFVDLLSYTLKGDTGSEEFNLVREKKNVGDSKKVDGAIVNGLRLDGEENVITVIELKSSTTSDLDKIEDQAFHYKNSHGCKYVITSNFEFLRFYIDNFNDYESFNLFNMNFEQFKLFYLILSKQSIFSDLPAKMKAQSLEHEQDVSKKLYKDYSVFKRNIFDNLVKNNSQIDKLTLLHNSQKILDRLLFIFFAEDKGLIPANTIANNIIAHYQRKIDDDEKIPLYDIFKRYFGYIDTGHKGKPYDTHGYNGDLFKSDAELDSLIIDDEILYNDTQKLSEYDFESEVDVNILGHIFEHSLNEIEALQAEIKGEDFDSKTSKRKKDGVFYTPKYITKYIVDNTVGKLCTEKKAELQIIYEDYEKGRKNLQQKTINAQIQKLKDYRSWLLELKICDPACGSGAFLNQALEFLIHEHHFIDKLDSIFLGGDIVYPNVEKSILENNLYGVDINDEAIEIAKLSLWLRTAQKGRKLSSLHSKIKVGNSLIDDKEVAGDKAFNWHDKFPEVFGDGSKNGFDCVVGNPPYVQIQTMTDDTSHLKSKYDTYEQTGDLYLLFYEKGNNILKQEGLLGFISGSAWIRTNYGKSLRKLFIEKVDLLQLIDFSDCHIFDGATVLTSIVSFRKSKSNNHTKAYRITQKDEDKLSDINTNFNNDYVILSNLSQSSWVITDKVKFKIKQKVEKLGTPLKKWDLEIYRGILTGYNEAFIIDGKKRNELISQDPKSSEIIKPLLRGRDVQKWNADDNDLWLISTIPSQNINIDDYKAIKEYLNIFGKRIEQTGLKGSRKKTNNKWFELQDSISYWKIFERPKIIYPNMTKFLPFHLDKENYYTNQKCFIITGDSLEYLVSFLNSKLFRFCFEENFPELQGNTREMNKVIFETLPIKKITPTAQAPFIEKADIMLSQNKELQEVKAEFLDWLKDRFEIEKLSKKLETFEDLEQDEFSKELKKKLPKEQRNFSPPVLKEVKQYFTEYKTKAQAIKQIIDTTDREIDKMVYELYELTDEEIKIVEGG